MRGFGVEISALLAGAAFAAAIPAVIEVENRNAGFEERAAGVQAMADVSGVSVAKEHGDVGAGRIGGGGVKPAVQLDAITGLEIDILEGAAQLGTCGFQEPVRMINLAMFKPTQHDVNQKAG